MLYGPISITFICTPGLPEKKYFENWQDLIINKETWEARFYKNYIGALDIFSLDAEENDRYVSLLYEVFPKTVNAQDFGAGSNDAYQTITVEFAFRWWESMFIDIGPQKPQTHTPGKLHQEGMSQRAKELSKKGWQKPPPSSSMGETSGHGHPGFKHHNWMNQRGE
jgi:hypothetical protein